ncbi:MAG: hypothetical protein ACOZBL_04570 [Patescibacteria group bacterium]
MTDSYALFQAQAAFSPVLSIFFQVSVIISHSLEYLLEELLAVNEYAHLVFIVFSIDLIEFIYLYKF